MYASHYAPASRGVQALSSGPAHEAADIVAKTRWPKRIEAAEMRNKKEPPFPAAQS